MNERGFRVSEWYKMHREMCPCHLNSARKQQQWEIVRDARTNQSYEKGSLQDFLGAGLWNLKTTVFFHPVLYINSDIASCGARRE